MGTDNLELQAFGERAMFSEVKPCELTLEKQHLQENETFNCATVSASKQGDAPSRKASTGDSERLSHFYGLLKALAKLNRNHSNMEALLQTASRLVVDMLDLDHCSVGWLDKNELCIRVWTSHTRKGANVNTGRVHRVFSNCVNREQHKCSNSDSARYGLGPDRELWRRTEITAPLRVDKQIVGYLYGLKGECSKACFLDAEKSMFSILSLHISIAIEAQRTREMLDCPYISLALSSKERESLTRLSPVERLFLEPVNNPEKLVRKIAHRFFEDFRRAGFDAKQIMCVATELLDSLLVVLRRTQSNKASSKTDES